MYGEIIHSSLVLLYNTHTQESHEHFLVLFSFHLLILSLDHSQQDFVYEGILPLSGLSFRTISLDRGVSHSPHVFETSSPMMESKVFICASGTELQQWLSHLEDRRYKSMTPPMSPSQCALSYLLPCDEHWKREELKTYLMQAPIGQWEGSPIQHMGQPGCISMVHIANTQKQGHQKRLMVLFPHDVLFLSVDSKSLTLRYEGRLPRHGIKAVERSALPGRMEFELMGELVEPLLITCAHQEDYWNWIFHLQQTETATLL
uniref:Si:dkey-21o19.2 n=2 Tax=Tetraodon nigroviridis TaxID=99883 RepID=H3CZZ1_TETNG